MKNLLLKFGGANQNFQKTKGVTNSFLAVDIRNSVGNKVQLWLLGLKNT
jgi:hypothetical protein